MLHFSSTLSETIVGKNHKILLIFSYLILDAIKAPSLMIGRILNPSLSSHGHFGNPLFSPDAENYGPE